MGFGSSDLVYLRSAFGVISTPVGLHELGSVHQHVALQSIVLPRPAGARALERHWRGANLGTARCPAPSQKPHGWSDGPEFGLVVGRHLYASGTAPEVRNLTGWVNLEGTGYALLRAVACRRNCRQAMGHGAGGFERFGCEHGARPAQRKITP